MRPTRSGFERDSRERERERERDRQTEKNKIEQRYYEIFKLDMTDPPMSVEAKRAVSVSKLKCLSKKFLYMLAIIPLTN